MYVQVIVILFDAKKSSERLRRSVRYAKQKCKLLEHLTLGGHVKNMLSDDANCYFQ